MFLIVTLKSTSEAIFRGFMIQGRVVADNSPVGTWQVQAPVVQTVCNGEVSWYFNVIQTVIKCPLLTQTAATHVNRGLKRLVTLSWKAPSAGTGTIRFRYEYT